MSDLFPPDYQLLIEHHKRHHIEDDRVAAELKELHVALEEARELIAGQLTDKTAVEWMATTRLEDMRDWISAHPSPSKSEEA